MYLQPDFAKALPEGVVLLYMSFRRDKKHLEDEEGRKELQLSFFAKNTSFPRVYLADTGRQPYARFTPNAKSPREFLDSVRKRLRSGTRSRALRLKGVDAAASDVVSGLEQLAEDEVLFEPAYEGLLHFLKERGKKDRKIRRAVEKAERHGQLEAYDNDEKPDWDEVHAFLRRHRDLDDSRAFVYVSSRLVAHLRKEKEYVAALALLKRIRKSAYLANVKGGAASVEKAIQAIEKARADD